IMDKWGDYFDVLKKNLANAPGRISFTADIWSNQSRYPFLAITTHWIEKDDSGHLKL
ncbi:hypothetical protein BC826DRAFT_926478, partial [Russula brevipes]